MSKKEGYVFFKKKFNAIQASPLKKGKPNFRSDTSKGHRCRKPKRIRSFGQQGAKLYSHPNFYIRKGRGDRTPDIREKKKVHA